MKTHTVVLLTEPSLDLGKQLGSKHYCVTYFTQPLGLPGHQLPHLQNEGQGRTPALVKQLLAAWKQSCGTEKPRGWPEDKILRKGGICPKVQRALQKEGMRA